MPPAEAIPVAEGLLSRYEVAAQVLDRAVQAGCQDPNVLYMLAMAHKRQGKTAEARNALRKIAEARRQRPPANGPAVPARKQPRRRPRASCSAPGTMDKSSYEICYNLLLTQLTLGKVDECLELLPQAIELTSGAGNARQEERRFLVVLQALLQVCAEGQRRSSSPIPCCST